MKKVWDKWTRIALVKRILVGLILGAILGIAVPQATGIAILGDVFVSALKAIAPLLVFFLVISSLCNAGKSHGGVIKTVIILCSAGKVQIFLFWRCYDYHIMSPK